MNNNDNKTHQNKSSNPGGTQQQGDKGKQAAPGKDQGQTGTEKREAGTSTDKK